MENWYIKRQYELSLTYEAAQRRMACHKEYTKKCKGIVDNSKHFKTEKEAVEYVIARCKEDEEFRHVWVKIEKDEEFYKPTNDWVVTEGDKNAMAAEYIGLALMYDDVRLSRIISSNINIDDVIAYY